MRDSKKKKKEKGASETETSEGKKEEGKTSREAVACSSEIIVVATCVFCYNIYRARLRERCEVFNSEAQKQEIAASL